MSVQPLILLCCLVQGLRGGQSGQGSGGDGGGGEAVGGECQ